MRGRAARRPQGRRRLRAARSRLSGRSGWRFGLTDSGAAAAGHRGEAGSAGSLPAGLRAVRLDLETWPARRRSRRRPTLLARHSGLRHLHLGLHRPAQGRGGDPRATWRGCSRPRSACFGFGADDVWTLFHSYAFDFSVWEIWGALAPRRPPGGGALLGEPLAARVRRACCAAERVTVLNQTPSAFRLLMAAEARDVAGGARAALGDLRRRGARRPRAWRPGSSATATSARAWSTCTASPRRRCTSPGGRCGRADLGRRGSRIGRPLPRPRASTCWTTAASRCRSACRARSTSAAPGWRAAISAGRS